MAAMLGKRALTSEKVPCRVGSGEVDRGKSSYQVE
jgi:hypothetical protein